MTPERWQQIEALYHTAQARPAGERAAFLAEESGADEDLRREVEGLLRQSGSNDGFLAGRASDLTSGLTAAAPMVGRTLGGYELEKLIGIGGMGEVYRARDGKLGRDVAIKVLPPAFTSDPGRLARFDREARTLAALNHPNICAIHGFEHADEIRFLVLELVGGQTLAEVIAQGHAAVESVSSRLEDSASAAGRVGGAPRGLKIDDALNIARQIARALDFAHARGIVHRDLKPANIKVTPDGAVKVLDFGLAKATAGDAAGADLEAAPDVTHNGTIEGSLLGTPAYMSPEQARGKPIDKRTDIWAFGCVLYEMLTGRAAFAGDTMADTIARVIEREPDWSALPRSTPEPIRQLLRACLVKDSQQRLQDIGGVTIESILSGSTSGTIRAPAARGVKPPLFWIKWATVAAALTAGIAWGVWPAPNGEQTLDLPDDQFLDTGGAHVIRISPDAARLAYVASPSVLYMWPLTGPDSGSKPVPGTQAFKGVRDAEFSPDGKYVAFYSFADHALMWMPVGGGPAVKICDAETPTGIYWGPNGMVLFGQGRHGIWQASVNAEGAEQKAKVRAGEQADGPWLLPDNDHYLFTIAKGRSSDRWDNAQIVVQSLSGTGVQTSLGITGSDVRYLPTLHLLIYAVSGRLLAIRFDPDTLTTQGNAVPVLDGVSRSTGSLTGGANFSISDDGTLAYVKGPVDATPPLLDVAIVEDPTGKTKPRKLNADSDRYESIRMSPDGSKVAAGVEAKKEEPATIYTIATNGGTSRQLFTWLDSDYRDPAWTHDGRRIAFQSHRHHGIWWQAADRTDGRRLTWAAAGEEHIPESWSADGTLLYSITTNGTARLWTLPVRNGRATTTPSSPSAIDPAAGKPLPFGNETSSDPMSATFSPDSKAVAYARTDKGETTVCVELFPSQGATCLEPSLGESPKHPRWSKDGKLLYYNPRPAELESVEVALGRDVQFGRRQKVPYQPIWLAPPGHRTSYDINKDGQLVGLIPIGQDEFRLIPAKTIVVVRNWFETLKQKLK